MEVLWRSGWKGRSVQPAGLWLAGVRRVKRLFCCQCRSGRLECRRMLLRSHLPKLTLALLALFPVVCVAEAVEYNRSSAMIATGCSCSGESALTSSNDPGDTATPAPSANHAWEDCSCDICPFSLSLCIEWSPGTAFLAQGTQRLQPLVYETFYETPSFTFFRPPRS